MGIFRRLSRPTIIALAMVCNSCGNVGAQDHPATAASDPAGETALLGASLAFHPVSFGDRTPTVTKKMGAGSVAAFEMPPIVIGQSGVYDRIYLLPGNWSWLCVSKDNLADGGGRDVTFEEAQCRPATWPVFLKQPTPNNSAYYQTDQAIHDTPLSWRKTGDWITGAEAVGQHLLFVRHGEHIAREDQDPSGQWTRFHSDIITKGAPDCAFKYGGGSQYVPCWERFNNFANFGSLPYPGPLTAGPAGIQGLVQPFMDDAGPFLWAQSAYNQDGGAPVATMGAKTGYHPTMLADGGFVYSWFNKTDAGQYACLAAARAPVSAAGVVDPTSWKAFGNARTFADPALPAGFAPDRIGDFYATKGPDYACALVDEPRDRFHIIYFNVARLFDRGVATGLYAAAEERLVFDGRDPAGVWQLGMRLSANLTDWSEFQLIRDEVPGGWGVGSLEYPTFLDEQGTSHTTVDRCSFYLEGTRPNGKYQLVLQHLGIDLPGRPDCAPPPPAPPSLALAAQTWGQPAQPVSSAAALTYPASTGMTIWYSCAGADTAAVTKQVEPFAPVADPAAPLAGSWAIPPGTQGHAHLWAKCFQKAGAQAAGEVSLILD